MVFQELSNVSFKCQTLTVCLCSLFQQTLLEHFICSRHRGDKRHCPMPQRAHSPAGNRDKGIQLKYNGVLCLR